MEEGATIVSDPIEYLLNAMEFAAQQNRPAEHQYGDKRRAVLSAIRELRRERDELAQALREYTELFPVFRARPLGTPGSPARRDQEREIALEDRARALLARVAQDGERPGTAEE